MASNQSTSQDTFFSQSAEPDDRDGKPDRQWFWPRYRVFNDVASQIVDQLLAITGLRDNKANQIILASFLQAAQKVYEKESKYRSECLLVWLAGHRNKRIDVYSNYPNVGDASLKAAREALEGVGVLTQPVAAEPVMPALGHLRPEDLAWLELLRSPDPVTTTGYPDPTTYKVQLTEDLVTLLRTAAFIDSNRAEVLINRPEDQQWEWRKHWDLPKQRMTRSDMLQFPKNRIGARREPIKELAPMWQKHPLVMPSTQYHGGRAFGMMTRIFHDGEITRGGRFYGGFTNIRKYERRKLTIDGENVVEIDFNASQPTLFSTLLGIRMNVPETWRDAYADVMRQLQHVDEFPVILRTRVKTAVVEMIGSGLPKKATPASDNLYFDAYRLKQTQDVQCKIKDKTSLHGLYRQIVKATLHTFPALEKLDPKLYKGSAFLSFHESELLGSIMVRLKRLGIVSYGLHDCVFVKQSDALKSVDVIRSETNKYVQRYQKKRGYSVLPLEVGLSISGIVIDGELIDEVKLQAAYCEPTKHTYVDNELVRFHDVLRA